jgi:UPF0716 family protein affecting phage T7 exclusion
MKRTVLISAAIALFLLVSPASAIQKKGGGSSRTNAAAQAQDKKPDSGDKTGNVTQPDEPRKSDGRQPPVEIKKDRFIDENDDGINDDIKKEPTVKIKKKDPVEPRQKSREPEKTVKKKRG